MMAGSKTSLRRPAKGCAFRGVPEGEDAGSKRNLYEASHRVTKLVRSEIFRVAKRASLERARVRESPTDHPAWWQVRSHSRLWEKPAPRRGSHPFKWKQSSL